MAGACARWAVSDGAHRWLLDMSLGLALGVLVECSCLADERPPFPSLSLELPRTY